MTADAASRARAATGDLYGRAMQQPAPDGDVALDRAAVLTYNASQQYLLDVVAWVGAYASASSGRR